MSKDLKVFLITEGGKKVGFGHITRCLSLYQALAAKKIRPTFIINGDDSIKNLLKNKDYLILNWIKEKKKLSDLVKDAEIVVVDSYLAPLVFYKTIFEKARIPVYIDDNKRLDYPRGVIINGNIYAKEINYPPNKGKKYLLGPEYLALRKEFWDIPKKKINKEVKNVLITFGGMSFYDKLYKIVDYLKKNFNFNFHIVNPKKKRVNAREMLILMLKADICIAGGGQTLYELARVGLPTLAVVLGKDQLRNTKAWQKRGFIEYAGWWRDAAIESKIKNELEKVIPRNVRLNKSRSGQRIIDGKGAMRVISKLISYNEEN